MNSRVEEHYQLQQQQRVYSVATGDEVILDYQLTDELIGKLDITGNNKELLPFYLKYNDEIYFYYNIKDLLHSANLLESNTQPITLEALLPAIGIYDNSINSNVNSEEFEKEREMNVAERVKLLMERANTITKVSSDRLQICLDRQLKRERMILAKETLIHFIQNTIMIEYTTLINDANQLMEENESIVNELLQGREQLLMEQFINIKTIDNGSLQKVDNTLQNENTQKNTLMELIKEDEEQLKQLITNIDSFKGMIQIQKFCSTHCQKKLLTLSKVDNSLNDQLNEQLEKMDDLLDLQKNKFNELNILYNNIVNENLQNIDLQLEHFEMTANQLIKELINLDNKIREIEALYFVNNYNYCKDQIIDNLIKICDNTLLSLLVNTIRYFTIAKENGNIERIIFLSKLPEKYKKLIEEIYRRREKFNEDNLLKEFYNFKNLLKEKCEEENYNRESIEKLILNSLNTQEMKELKKIIPGVIGERIPIDAIMKGLEKLMRSITRTVDRKLPTLESLRTGSGNGNGGNDKEGSMDDDDDDYFLVLPRDGDNSGKQEEEEDEKKLKDMTTSVYLKFAERKVDEQLEKLNHFDNLFDNNVNTNYSNVESNIEPPKELMQSILVDPMLNSNYNLNNSNYGNVNNNSNKVIEELNGQVNSLQKEIEKYKKSLLEMEDNYLKQLLEEKQKYNKLQEEKSKELNDLFNNNLNLQNEVNTLQNSLQNEVELNKEKSDVENELSMKIKELLNENEKLKLDLNGLQNSNENKENSLQKSLEDKLKEMNNLKVEFEEKLYNNELQIRKLKEENERCLKEKYQVQSDLEEHCKSLNCQVDDLQNRCEKVTKENSALRNELTNVYNELTIVNKNNKEVTDQLEFCKDEKNNLQKKLNELTCQLKDNLLKNDDLQETMSQLQNYLQNVTSKLKDSEMHLQKVQETNEMNLQEISDLKLQLQRYSLELKDLQDQLIDKEQIYNELQEKSENILKFKNAEINTFEEKIKELQNTLQEERKVNLQKMDELNERLDLQNNSNDETNKLLLQQIDEMKERINILMKEKDENLNKLKNFKLNKEELQKHLQNVEEALKNVNDKLQQKVFENEQLNKEIEKLKQQSSPIMGNNNNLNNNQLQQELERVQRQLKEETFKNQMMDAVVSNSTGIINDLNNKLKQNVKEIELLKEKLKEQEETYNLIQNEFNQLNSSYIKINYELQQTKQLNNNTLQQQNKIYVAIEPTDNDCALFFKSRQNKSLFEAFNRKQEHIYLAPEVVESLKEKYGNNFEQLGIVVGKILFKEEMNSNDNRMNPLSLGFPYYVAYIEEL